MSEWFWCLRHQRVEGPEEYCGAEDRLGPYASAAEAENWRERVAERNEEWDADDRAWEGDED